MKIICLIESLQSGGAERQLAYMASFLNMTHDVQVWTYYPHDFYLPILESNKVRYRYLKELQDKKTRIIKLYSALKDEKPDVVIAYLDTVTTIACICKFLRLRFKLIVSERNTTQTLTVRDRIKFFLYRYADIIVPNSYTQTFFINLNFPRLSRKLITITNYIDTDKFSPKPDIGKWSMGDGLLHIISVGRLMPQKNVLRYIDVVNELKNRGFKVKIHWYGGIIDTAYYELIESRIKECGLEDWFEINRPSTQINDEYIKADVFCLPSIYEGFPNVVCEAMSSGLPILTSNVCDNPLIVMDGVNGYLFDPNSVEDILNKILRFYNLPNSEKLKMSQRSRDLAIENFSRVKFIEKYQSILE